MIIYGDNNQSYMVMIIVITYIVMIFKIIYNSDNNHDHIW